MIRVGSRAGALAIATALCGMSVLSAAQNEKAKTQRDHRIGTDIRLPAGYRDWTLISVAQENGSNNDIRAILGNAIAVKAFRQGRRPFPDGAIIVRLAWRYQSSPRNDAVFPAPQSFIAGEPTNIQISVKNAKRYASTGGWGYGQFDKGLAPVGTASVQACFACHAKLEKSADLVFTDWSL